MRGRIQLRVGSIRVRGFDECGASLVEYTLLLALIVGVAIGAFALVGYSSADLLNNSAQQLGR